LNRFLLAAALLAAAFFSAVPDLFYKDRPLHLIETLWFDIVFPEESTPEARYLASFADELYVELAALLGTQPRHRLPVVITPDHEQINGYFTNYPYLRIVLYQAATDMNSALGSFKDNLRSLFTHELTHAVSLTIRGPVQEALVTVFGSPLGLSMYTTALNLVEGVTVSFESLGGYGRTADPLAGALIRQDLLEGTFKSFTRTMGTWDRYPGRTLYYIYGGYFSSYLQETHGMENYARLWQRIGSGMLTRPLDDFLFIQGHFRKVYGISLREAWADFGKTMGLQSEVQANGPVKTGLSAISTLAAEGSLLYWADSALGAVFSLDTGSGQSQRLFPAGAMVTRLAPGPDNSRLLVSATGYEHGYSRHAIHEWDTVSGNLTRLPYRSLRDATYLPGAKEAEGMPLPLLAIQTQGYATSLVLARNGEIKPLLHGNLEISFASPVASPDGWIHALVKESGIISVLRFRLEGEAAVGLQTLSLPEGLGWLRYLSLADGILRFSWDDAAFYRLIELDGEVVRFQTVPTSGGVHQAVSASGSVFHLGYFSEGTAVCAFPADRGQLGFQEAPAVWEAADHLLETRPVRESTETPPGAPSSQVRQYSPLPWLLPRFWHPIAAGTTDGLTMAGAAVYMADPIERLSGYLSGGWNPRVEAPGYEAVMNLALTPFFLRFSLSDDFIPAASSTYPARAIRQGNAGLTMASATQPFAGGSIEFGVSGAVQGWAETLDRTDRYRNWDMALAYASAYGVRQDMKQTFSKPGLREGYLLGAAVRSLAPLWPAPGSLLSGIEVQAAVASSFLGLELAGYAGLSLSDGLLYGPAGASMRTAGLGEVSVQAYPHYMEFNGAPAGIWHLQAEVSVRSFSFEVQQAAGPLYTRRLDLRTGSRALLTSRQTVIRTSGGTTDSESGSPMFDWSLFSRLELAFVPAIGILALARPVAWVELWYRPLDETWGLGYVRELSF
jgi:hypothetical protein